MSTFNLKTTDSCTVTMKGQKLPGGINKGAKVRVEVEGAGSVEGEVGHLTEYQLCFTKGSPAAKQLADLLKPNFQKGQAQAVTIEIL